MPGLPQGLGAYLAFAGGLGGPQAGLGAMDVALQFRAAEDQRRQQEAAAAQQAALMQSLSPQDRPLAQLAPGAFVSGTMRGRQAPRPVAVSPGQSLVDPRSGKPMYTAAPKPQRAPAPYTDIAKIQADLSTGRITRKQADRMTQLAMQGQGPASNLPSEARMAQFYSEVMGVPMKDALQTVMQSASNRQTPENLKQEIMLKALQTSYGNVEQAQEITDQTLKYLQGGDQPAAEPEPGFFTRLWGAIAGTGEDAPPAPAEVARRATQPAQPAQQQAAPAQLPVKPGGGGLDASQLQVGAVYRHPRTGQPVRWDGSQFVAVGPGG